MVGYTVAMFIILLMSGFGDETNFRLNDAPLTTLIGGAFASTVGLVTFVMKGLFPVDREPPVTPTTK